MSTTLSLPARSRSSRRTPILAAASALVAAASITVTLAVAGGGDSPARPASGTPATAQPDRATLYQHGVETGAGSLPSAADRFHHFR